MNLRSRTVIAAAIVGLASVCATAPPARAEASGEAGVSEARLALKLRNPIADLVTVPIEIDIESGARGASTVTLYAQPVVPFALGDQWLLVTRTIVPFISQQAIEPGERDSMGLGDVTQSFFVSPSRLVGGWIVGAGPVFQYPTAADPDLGGGRWGAGPTAAILRQAGGWSFGVLASHLWSFAGDDGRDRLNTTLVDPFVSYTWPNDVSLELECESTLDREERQWTVPPTAVVSRLVTVGRQSVSLGVGGRWYADSPEDGAEWGAVFSLTLVSPR